MAAYHRPMPIRARQAGVTESEYTAQIRAGRDWCAGPNHEGDRFVSAMLMATTNRCRECIRAKYRAKYRRRRERARDRKP